MNVLEQFNTRVEAFLADTRMSPRRFGELAMRDPGFVFDLRRGREPRISSLEKAEKFMADYDPCLHGGVGHATE